MPQDFTEDYSNNASKALPEPMLTKSNDAIWRLQAVMN